MKSITLDYCWVCGVRFNDAKPAGPANREEHHIIPRQAGGTNGPTVSLCENHHGILHKIAVGLNSKKPKPYHHLISDLDQEQQKRLLYLASTAANAFRVTKNDPNKKRVLVMNLDGDVDAMIEKLKGVYPNANSRESIVKIAVHSLFNKHFLQRP